MNITNLSCSQQAIYWAASCRKVPNELSHCHTKGCMCLRGRAYSSFGKTLTWKNNFTKKSGQKCRKIKKKVKEEEKKKDLNSRCCTNTTTQVIRDIFMWHDSTGICMEGKHLDLLLVIISSHREDAALRRQVIRETWANYTSANYTVNHMFVLGK